MNKSILILEENSIIHGLIASALDLDGLTLHHEFDPEEYVERARSLMPDLILLSNADQERDYQVCRALRADESVSAVPLVLLANSRDQLINDSLQQLQVDGVIRKPFEASDLQQQVSKHLNIVDLIGSAYDYKKSQSLREEGIDPLADMEVLDREILGFLHESAARPGEGVPEVDFSRELQSDAAPAAAGVASAAAATAGLAAEPEPLAESLPPEPEPLAGGAEAEELAVDEATLEETLQPERAFEAVEPEGDDFDEAALGAATEGALEEELTLGGAAAEEEELTLGETAVDEEPLGFGQPPELEEVGLEAEELGPADVLEEEGPEEAALAPEGFEQGLTPEPEESETPLDEVEVELAGAEVAFGSEEADEAGEERVELFETDLSEEAEAAPAQDEEGIPQAVRRLVELRPVLSKGGERVPTEPELQFAPADDELASMADELAQMDEIEVAGAVAASETEQAGEGEDWKLAGTPSAEDEDEEFFHEDYLGDEEIDEEKIREAMSHPGAEDAETAEEETYVADLVEDRELEGLDALEEVPEADEGGEEPEELTLEPDEESIVLSSIERDEALDSAIGEETPLETPELEAGPMLETAGEEEEPAARESAAGGLIDEQLEALESAAAESEELLEREPELESDTEGAVFEGLEPEEEPVPAAEPEDLSAEFSPEPEREEEFFEQTQAPRPEEPLPEWGTEGTEEAGAPAPDTLESAELEDETTAAAFEQAEVERPEAPLPEWGTEPPAGEAEPLADESEFVLAEPEAVIEMGGPEEAPEAPATGEGAEESPFISEAARQAADYAASEEETIPPEQVAAGDEQEEGAVFADSDFDSALRELQMEIESNPEGERLEDVLAQEGVLDAVDALEFHIPRNEHVFTRALGIMELPDQGGVDPALIDRLTVEGAGGPVPGAEAAPAATAPTAASAVAAQMAAAGASVATGLHEEVVARLGHAIDDVIRDEVRRIVREEMPGILERIREEESGHGR